MRAALGQLIATLEQHTINGDSQLMISDLHNDSREVVPGSLFFAIRGYQADGHLYIGQAVQKGALAVVVEEEQRGLSVPQIVVPNTRVAQSSMAAEFYGHPSKLLQVSGVTGTNGKTTCSFMIDQIASSAGLKTGVMGTLYNKIADTIQPTINTTPDSILCQQLLSRMVKEGVKFVSMEVSSHAMVMHRVDDIHFNSGAITNISADHLDLHQNMEDYLRAKQRFFELLPEESFAITNFDDPAATRIASDTTKAAVVSYSVCNTEADVCLVATEKQGRRCMLSIRLNREFDTAMGRVVPGQQIAVPSWVPGQHNIYNTLLAVATALSLGLPIEAIQKGMNDYKGVFRRFEKIYDGEFEVVDDATHNPGNMEAVFRSVEREHKEGIVVVYAIRGNRGVQINKAIASTLRYWLDRLRPRHTIITKCVDTACELDLVQAAEEQAFRKTLRETKSNITYTESLREAVRIAISSVRGGDILLLLGAHPMDNVSQVFAEEFGEEISLLPRPPKFGGN